MGFLDSIDGISLFLFGLVSVPNRGGSINGQRSTPQTAHIRSCERRISYVHPPNSLTLPASVLQSGKWIHSGTPQTTVCGTV